MKTKDGVRLDNLLNLYEIYYVKKMNCSMSAW